MGYLPYSTQGIFDIRKKILAAPFLPLHSIWNHKRASFSSITKIAEFFEWDLFQIQHKEFLTMTKIVRKKERPLYFSGSFCQVIVKNSLCWIWKRSHLKKFQNSTMLVIQLKWAIFSSLYPGRVFVGVFSMQQDERIDGLSI